MTYFKCEVEGPDVVTLSERETTILQNTFLNLAALSNALVVGGGIMLNPPDEGKRGITFAYPEAISKELESEIKVVFTHKLNTLFNMSKLNLEASVK